MVVQSFVWQTRCIMSGAKVAAVLVMEILLLFLYVQLDKGTC